MSKSRCSSKKAIRFASIPVRASTSPALNRTPDPKPMLDDKLKELLDFAKKTDLQELVWQKGGTKISFRRSESAALAQAKAPEIETPDVEEAEPEPVYIKSTMVGTFF